jgi:hypothetical protein
MGMDGKTWSCAADGVNFGVIGLVWMSLGVLFLCRGLKMTENFG